MPVRLRLVRGPLDDDALRATAALYGPFNSKYGDVEFCRQVFNRNVQGWALHAILEDADDGRPVGHYALVPFALSRGREQVLSGKGEAFVILEPYRGESLSVGDEPALPCGLAMALHLYRFGAEHGLDPIHMIANEEVGLLHRMAGCRGLRIARRRFVLAVSPGRMARARASAAGSLVLWLAAAAQRILSGLLMRSRAAPGPARAWDVSALEPEQRERLARALARSPGWSAHVDAPALDWFARVGRLQVVATDDTFRDCALVCRRADQDQVMEIVAWNLSRPDPAVAFRLLAQVADEAHRHGNRMVSLSSLTLALESDLALLMRTAAAALFRETKGPLLVFVRSRDDRFLDAASYGFTPFFHATF